MKVEVIPLKRALFLSNLYFGTIKEFDELNLVDKVFRKSLCSYEEKL